MDCWQVYHTMPQYATMNCWQLYATMNYWQVYATIELLAGAPCKLQQLNYWQVDATIELRVNGDQSQTRYIG
jgi:hypothetical protein